MKNSHNKEDFNTKQQNQVDSIFLEFLITNLFAENKIFSTFTKFLPELTKSQNYEIDGIFQFTKSIDKEIFKDHIMQIFSEKNIKATIAGENIQNLNYTQYDEKNSFHIQEGDFLIFETKLNSSNIQEEILNYDKLSKIEKKILKSKKFKKLTGGKNCHKPNFFLIFFYNTNHSSDKEKITKNFDFLKKNSTQNTIIIYTDCKSVLRQTLKIEKVNVKTVVDLVEKVDKLENEICNLNQKFDRLNSGFENILNEFNKRQKEKEKEIEDLKEVNDMQEKIIFNYKTINKSVSETYRMIESVNEKNDYLTEENLKLRKVCEMNMNNNKKLRDEIIMMKEKEKWNENSQDKHIDLKSEQKIDPGHFHPTHITEKNKYEILDANFSFKKIANDKKF